MKIKKVLLIAPPAITFKSCRDVNPMPPIGLGYLASVVARMDIEVKIVDCLLEGWAQEEEVGNFTIRIGLSDKQIEDLISDFKPDIVGVNCQFSRQYKIYHRVFSVIKKANPSCITVAGGAHATVCPQEVLSDEHCDYVLMGEAEDSFKDFILKIIREGELEDVDGIGLKAGGRPYINEKKKWIANLDSIPFPSYDIMGLEKYFGLNTSHGLRHEKKFAPIVTSRGCPAKCTFCSANKVWGDNYRYRSVGNVLEEMRMLRLRYGVEELMFEDDNVTANSKRAKELFSRMIIEKMGFVWDTPNGIGVWSIDKEMLGLIKKSGCIKLNLPVESGSQRVIDDIIKKPVKLSKVRELVRHCRKVGLDYGMFLVVGMPGETIKDIWKSFRFAAQCGCYEPHISVATPYPGTRLLEECAQNKLFAREYKLEDLFIKSFMISTPEWSESKLEKTLSNGLTYLKIKSLLADPKKSLRRLVRAFKEPAKFSRFSQELKNVLINN